MNWVNVTEFLAIKLVFRNSLSSVEHLGEDTDGTDFEVNGQWVFRFPKRADVDKQLAIESRILLVYRCHAFRVCGNDR